MRPTLAMPTPLLVVAAIRPAVWVPCQLLSPTAQSAPENTGLALSAWVMQSPGSEASLSRALPSLAEEKLVPEAPSSGLTMS